jgi:hypothetical protein
MTRSSARQRSHTGVCVVRAETQDQRLLITVTSNPDIETRSLTRLSRHAKDVPGTLGLVADFLDEVAALHRAPDDRDDDLD